MKKEYWKTSNPVHIFIGINYRNNLLWLHPPVDSSMWWQFDKASLLCVVSRFYIYDIFIAVPDAIRYALICLSVPLFGMFGHSFPCYLSFPCSFLHVSETLLMSFTFSKYPFTTLPLTLAHLAVPHFSPAQWSSCVNSCSWQWPVWWWQPSPPAWPGTPIPRHSLPKSPHAYTSCLPVSASTTTAASSCPVLGRSVVLVHSEFDADIGLNLLIYLVISFRTC